MDLIAAAVFDCDGLLIDSAGCWRVAYERALANDGRSLGEEMLAALNGASVAQAAATLQVGCDVLLAELLRAFATEPLPARPGAHALLMRLRGSLPLAVATNAPRELAALALRRTGLSPYLPIVVSAKGMREKPAPDVYLAACELLGVPTRRAVALEDSPLGAAAARAAGLRLIYVPSAECGDAERGDAERGCVAADLEVGRLDDEAVFATFCALESQQSNENNTNLTIRLEHHGT